MVNIKSLLNKRSAILSKVTRQNAFLESDANASASKVEFEFQLKKCEDLWKEFDDIQTQIEENTPENVDVHETDRDRFETSYFLVVSAIQTRITQFTGNNSVAVSQGPAVAIPAINVRLPNIELSRFSGAYNEWLTFRDTFNALIHNNENLTDVQRFHYLKSSLTGDAAKAVNSITIAESNYATAWDLLHDRFHNRKLIVRTHIAALVNLPPIGKPTATALRSLIDEADSHLGILTKLELPVEYWDTLIIHLISMKLDLKTSAEWEEKSSDFPTWTEFSSFIIKKCLTAEAVESNLVKINLYKNQPAKPMKIASHLSQSFVQTCPLCNKTHTLHQCDQFLELEPPERRKKVQILGRCLNCLRSGHKIANFPAGSCRKCKKRHHTTLHVDPVASQSVPPEDNAPTSPINTLLSGKGPNKAINVFLSTAVVNVRDLFGKLRPVKTLLDSGSQANFITDHAVNKLRLQGTTINETISGIGKTKLKSSKRVTIHLHSQSSSFKTTLNCLVLPHLTSYSPTTSNNLPALAFPPNLHLADPNYNKAEPIDIILGNEIFFKLLCIGQVQLGIDQPILQNTKLGWIVAGNWGKGSNRAELSCNFAINDQLAKFWEIENPVNNKPCVSKDDQTCENLFINTHTRSPNAKFIVRLPLKPDHPNLGSSKAMALKRLQAMERKFNRSTEFKELYHGFIRDYETLGHMQKVTSPIQNLNCILQHHAVLRENNPTTKLRVVFDASVKSDAGVSLNDHLLIGPQLQNEFLDVLLRFRMPRYVFGGDIVKMYRQILIHEEDQKYQVIFWRDDPHLEPAHYQLKTVTYGTACAPYLAIRCLHQLAIENQQQFPLASSTILKNFYVDDVLAGCDTINETIDLREQISQILASGGFELSKWTSNCPNVISINNHNNVSPIIQIHKDQTQTLGVQWSTTDDEFNYNFKFLESVIKNKVTKRQTLSTIVQMFDSLGLIGLIVVNAKNLMQKLWASGVNWDHPVPLDIYTEYNKFLLDLQNINLIRTPRRVLNENSESIQLHGFCDASEQAYGACIYLRHSNKDGTYSTRLLIAKSRVAPLKKTILPRLELCGALLLSQLVNRVRNTLSVEFQSEYYWSDSTIVLSWISTPSHLLKTFVANRVCEIHSTTNATSWRHVRSADNPADIISRGSTTLQLSENELWWTGPRWLSQPINSWPPESIITLTSVPDCRQPTSTTSLIAMTDNSIVTLIDNSSSFLRLKRVVAYCLRFRYNLFKSPGSRRTGPLSASELSDSHELIIKTVQSQDFDVEIAALRNSKNLPRKSKILSLHPILDSKEIIRVGGRLDQASISYSKKHPILLPKSHHLTKYFDIFTSKTITCKRRHY